MTTLETQQQRLSGKVAIVSGAGTFGGSGVGNGAAAAILFARNGAKVVLVDAVSEWAEATAQIITEEGGEASTATADVTNPDDCHNVVAAAIERYGSLHILHNNVGGGGSGGSVVEATDEDWYRSASVNLMSMVNMCRYAIPHMKNAGSGSIINVSSVTALRPKPGRSSAQYTVNKSAVVGLTRALALDHADDNIRANCIMPGLMWTPRLESLHPRTPARCAAHPHPSPSKAKAGTSATPPYSSPATMPASSLASPSPLTAASSSPAPPTKERCAKSPLPLGEG